MNDIQFGDERSNRIDPAFLEVCHSDHLERYEFALQYAQGKRVLDIGCAAGYGSNLLASVGDEVYGIDIYEPTIRYASERYQRSNLTFQVADACQSPFPDGSFGLIVAFEVIEHLQQPGSLLQSINNMLDENGIAIISTPNQLVSAPEGGVSDPTHYREYSPEEFRQALNKSGFSVIEHVGQKIRQDQREVHSLRTKLSRSDILGIRHLIPASVKARMIRAIQSVKSTFTSREDQHSEAEDNFGSLDEAYVQMAICSRRSSN